MEASETKLTKKIINGIKVSIGQEVLDLLIKIRKLLFLKNNSKTASHSQILMPFKNKQTNYSPIAFDERVTF